MALKAFLGISGTIFAVIAVLHLLRAVYGWPAQIGTWIVPLWVSWLSLAIAAFLAVCAFRLLRK